MLSLLPFPWPFSYRRASEYLTLDMIPIIVHQVIFIQVLHLWYTCMFPDGTYYIYPDIDHNSLGSNW